MNYFEANNTQACTMTIGQPWLYDNVNVNENSNLCADFFEGYLLLFYLLIIFAEQS